VRVLPSFEIVMGSPPYDFSVLEPFDGSDVVVDHAVAFCIVVRISCHWIGFPIKFPNPYAVVACAVTVGAIRSRFKMRITMVWVL
jgi:hypothetical protein